MVYQTAIKPGDDHEEAEPICCFREHRSGLRGGAGLIQLGKLTIFSLNTAEAAVGRPLTATSVAGVSRRVQRRAYRRAAVGAVGVGAVGAGTRVAASGAPRSLGVVVAPGRSATVIDPATRRRCTIEPSGWHWCWRP
jgi:hypothetical protein